jgi:hypothetical protein
MPPNDMIRALRKLRCPSSGAKESSPLLCIMP